MTSIENLLIGFSNGFSGIERFNQTLDRLLLGRTPGEVTTVNDKQKLVEQRFCGAEMRIETKVGKNRLEVRQLVARASHIVIFWSGEDLHNFIWEAQRQKKPIRINPFTMTRVVNKDVGDEFDVYIGRRGPWGNPFPIVHGGSETRERVIARYAEYFESEIVSDPAKHKALLELSGLRLGCHCKPLPCHGDVIARYLNNYSEVGDDSDGPLEK